MYKTIIGVDGMHCDMCENYICETVRKSFEVRRVRASHGKKTAEIWTEAPMSEKALRKAIEATGYPTTTFSCVEAEDEGFFAKIGHFFGFS